MRAFELRQLAVELYGDKGWQTKLANALGVDGSSVRRWVSGAVDVPNPVAAAIRCFHAKKRLESGMPENGHA